VAAIAQLLNLSTEPALALLRELDS
jgi:hypothetical protein